MKALGDTKRFSFEQVRINIESVEGYKLLSTKYKKASQELEIQCPKGHVFKCSYNKFQQGQRCSICNESKGEQKVSDYFTSNNINFDRQYSFDDCRNIEPLRFDFIVFDNSGNISFMCEYDGEFHYLPILSKKKLKYQQKLDNIKNTYCQQNNIPLLRIPYWEFDNIEKILSKQLIKHKLVA